MPRKMLPAKERKKKENIVAFATTDQHESGHSASQAKARTLRTLQEICEYMRVSGNTVRHYARNLDFPARKVGGNWEADTEAIEDWKARRS